MAEFEEREIEIDRHDESLADLLQPDIGPLIRFDRSQKLWYAWRGFYWDADEAYAQNLLVAAARRHLATARRKEDVTAISALLDVRKQSTVMEALSRREGIRLTGDEFDRVPHLLGVANGVVDLRDGSFSAEGRPEDYISKRTRVPYESGIAGCPRFTSFIDEIMSGDGERAAYLLSMLGYALYGHQREQKFWLWVGKGQNGKSTLARLINWILGDYSDWPSSSLYMRTRFGARNASEANPALLRLQGIRFLPQTEPEGGQFNDELIKAHTGEDPINARPLYSNTYVQFRPTHTLTVLSNDPPMVNDVGVSMRRRVRVVDFLEDFSGTREDRSLEEKLKAEGKGVLRLLVARAGEYHRRRGLAPEPADVTLASDSYIEGSDPLTAFLDDVCVVGPRQSVTAELLWAAYLDWASTDLEHEHVSQKKLGQLLHGRFGPPKHAGMDRARTYVGVNVKGLKLMTRKSK